MLWRTNKKGQHYQPRNSGVKGVKSSAFNEGQVNHNFKKRDDLSDYEVNPDELEKFAREKNADVSHTNSFLIERIEELNKKLGRADWSDDLDKYENNVNEIDDFVDETVKDIENDPKYENVVSYLRDMVGSLREANTTSDEIGENEDDPDYNNMSTSGAIENAEFDRKMALEHLTKIM